MELSLFPVPALALLVFFTSIVELLDRLTGGEFAPAEGVSVGPEFVILESLLSADIVSLIRIGEFCLSSNSAEVLMEIGEDALTLRFKGDGVVRELIAGVKGGFLIR